MSHTITITDRYGAEHTVTLIEQRGTIALHTATAWPALYSVTHVPSCTELVPAVPDLRDAQRYFKAACALDWPTAPIPTGMAKCAIGVFYFSPAHLAAMRGYYYEAGRKQIKAGTDARWTR